MYVIPTVTKLKPHKYLVPSTSVSEIFFCQTHIFTQHLKVLLSNCTFGAFWIPEFSEAYMFRLNDNLSCFAAGRVSILKAL